MVTKYEFLCLINHWHQISIGIKLGMIDRCFNPAAGNSPIPTHRRGRLTGNTEVMPRPNKSHLSINEIGFDG
jgi:hypothetical protein